MLICIMLSHQNNVVYLITFAVQWNSRMESLRVAGGKGKLTSCVDPRQIQHLNQQSEVLFGKDHLFEPYFVAPIPSPEKHDEEEQLLGVEYAHCQSTVFKSKDYYVQKVDEEQTGEYVDEGEEEEDAESEDEGVHVDAEADPIDELSDSYVVLTTDEKVNEVDTPAMEDVCMTARHLHLPGFEEVEQLAMVLLKLADGGEQHLVPVSLRQKIAIAASCLRPHDRSARNFVRTYESKWGYTLFGRCLGTDSPLQSAAQKTKFSWMRYAHASQITEESRLLYILIKMLKNRPPTSLQSSSIKTASMIKGQYKRIVDRISDDPVLPEFDIPLPNINNKSITNFIHKQEKSANFRATTIPKVKPLQIVLSEKPLPETPRLPPSLPKPNRPEVQYDSAPHLFGRRHGEKRRLDFTALEVPRTRARLSTEKSTSTSTTSKAQSRLAAAASAPVLLVTPSQTHTPTFTCHPSYGLVLQTPPPQPVPKPVMPKKSNKPCSLCKVPNCGGKRKRYIPPKEKTSKSLQKLFTFCPTTRQSSTVGFDEEYEDYDHF